MWRCIFSSTTNRGNGCNREPMEGEFAKDIPSSLCAWFNVHPERYMWDEATQGLVSWPGWEAEELEKTKGQVWERIKTERDRRKDGGIKVGSHFYHSDNGSRIQHLGLKDEVRDMLAAGKTLADFVMIDGERVAWKTMSGQFVQLTGQDVLDIVAGGKSLDKQVFKAAEIHRATMRVSANPESYDFNTGWPERYVE